jgi:hypothetical protein
VFDMLNVSLVHGWLVDPQDAAYSTVSKLSYNQIVELIVNHQYVSLHSPCVSPRINHVSILPLSIR